MIDVLLQLFGPSLAKKLFSQNDDLTLQNLAEVSKELAEAFAESAEVAARHEQEIGAIQKELQGLTPLNVNSQLEEIYKWMQEHVASEQRTFSELARKQREMDRKQQAWNIGLACGIGVALILAVLCLVR